VVDDRRTSGALGDEVGLQVADRLGFRYVDEEIIRLAAERARVDPVVVAKAEWPKPLLMRVVNAIDELEHAVSAPTAWWTKPSQRDLRGLIRFSRPRLQETL